MQSNRTSNNSIRGDHKSAGEQKSLPKGLNFPSLFGPKFLVPVEVFF